MINKSNNLKSNINGVREHKSFISNVVALILNSLLCLNNIYVLFYNMSREFVDSDTMIGLLTHFYEASFITLNLGFWYILTEQSGRKRVALLHQIDRHYN